MVEPSIKGIIEMAIKKEQIAYKLYKKLEAEATSDSMKRCFSELAKEELDHEEKLKHINPELLLFEVNVDHVKHLHEPIIVDEENIQSLKEGILKAIQKEENENMSYRKLAELFPSKNKVRVLLDKLADEELKHKMKLVHLLEQINEVVIKSKPKDVNPPIDDTRL